MKLFKIIVLCSLSTCAFLSNNLNAQNSWPNFLPIITWGNLQPAIDEVPARPIQWPSNELIHHYYIDNTHPQSTDINNEYGFPDKPRLTIPQINYDAGSYIEIAGGPYQILNGSLQFNLSFNGTEEDPCWLFCDKNNPVEIQGEVNINASYLIIDGFHFDRNAITDKKTEVEIERSNHVCLRNSRIKDDGIFHPGFGAGVNINGELNSKTEEIIVFNCEIRDLDDPQHSINIEQDDNNGILAGPYTENIYIVSNSIFRCAGDGVVTNGNNALGDSRAKNVFVVNNEIYGNGENAFDIKSGRDVIIAENKLHNYVVSQGSDGAAIVVQQEGGDGSDNVWILFNEIYDSESSVRVEEQVTNCYVIGNLIRDQRDAYSAAYVRTHTAELSLIDNTIVRYNNIGFRWDDLPNVACHGNIFGLRFENEGYEIRASTSDENISLDYNLYDDSSNLRLRYLSQVYTTLIDWQINNPQAWDSNSHYDSAKFLHPDNNDFSLDSSSAAIDQNVEHPAYDVFFDRYQIDIKRDFSGNIRPQNGTWDIGAFEFQKDETTSLENISVTTNSQITLFPNPTKSFLKSSQGKISAIYSSHGIKLGNVEIIYTLDPGIYFAEVSIENKNKYVPFVKTN